MGKRQAFLYPGNVFAGVEELFTGTDAADMDRRIIIIILLIKFGVYQ
jgi:hypothetical protein